MRKACARDKVTLKKRAYELLTHPLRLEILSTLGLGDVSVRELAVALKVSPARLARHLSVLSQAGLVCRYHKAQHEYYRIVDPWVARTSAILYGVWSERLGGAGV